jgi:hypothetical protein
MAFDAVVLALCIASQPGPGKEPPEIPLPPPPVSGQFKALERSGAGKAKVTRVGVPEPSVVGEVSPRELAVLSQALVTEVRKLDGIAAIGVAEIREMLALEYRRQMLGCSQDENCLAEIAGALGVNELISSELVVQGNTSTFSLSRIDMRTTKVVAAAQKRLARRKAGEEVLGAVGEMVATVYKDRSLRAGEQRGVAPEVARWLNPPPLGRWVFFTTAGAAAAAAAGGAIYASNADSTRGSYNALATGGGTVSGSELTRLHDLADKQQRNATILFGLAGALVAAAGVEAFFTDWHNDQAAVRIGTSGATVVVKF